MSKRYSSAAFALIAPSIKDNTTDNPLVDFEEPFTYTSYADDISNTTPMTLKVVGIVTPKDDLAYGCLSSGFYYTEALTNKMLKEAHEIIGDCGILIHSDRGFIIE